MHKLQKINVKRLLATALCVGMLAEAGLPGMERVATPIQAQAAVTNIQRATIESALYNYEYYTNANEDVAVALGYDEEAMYQHWLNYGMAEGRNASMVFNAKYYLEKNPSVRAKVGNDYVAAYEHFVNEGLLAGLESSPVFSVKYYLEANTDVAAAFNGDYISAAQHFNENAIAEGRSGSGNFDYTVYRECNKDVEALYGDYIEGYYIHYINHGRAEGRTGGLASDAGSIGGGGEVSGLPVGTLLSVTENLGEALEETGINLRTYTASIAPVSQFVTKDGGYGVAYHGENETTILLYDKNLNLYNKVYLASEGADLGAVIRDEDGYFYAMYGMVNTTDDVTREVLRVVKYSPLGRRLQSVSFNGAETSVSGISYSSGTGGTKIPFDAANCCMAINQGILTITYGREMYNGHQSSNSLYLKTATMEKVDIKPIYTSHSFDQRVIATTDGGFLYADHGDAYGRAFTVSKLLYNGTRTSGELESFHFREGSNRSHGYNETYAQLGGIAETADSYVLVGASEKTLSLDVAPTNRNYCGYSEPRNLFIQYLKKNFYEYSEADCYTVAGTVRPATGVRPTNALTNLYLSEDVVDYGVIWLTDYTGDYLAYNPKVVTTELGEVVILWQKVKFATSEIVDTYYMMLDANGNVLHNATSLGNLPLTTDEPAVYQDGSIYWSVTEGRNLTTYRLVVSESLLSRVENEVSWRIFDADYYLQNYPELEEWVGTDELDLYLFWLNNGISMGQTASQVIHPAEYLEINTDVAQAVGYDHSAAIRHFLNYGIYEGRSGCREFDYTVYADCNTDVAEVFGSDIVGYYAHYVKHGIAEGRTARLSYDASTAGQLRVVPEGTKVLTLSDGTSVRLVFDEIGRITTSTGYNGDGSVKYLTSYTYRDSYTYINCQIGDITSYYRENFSDSARSNTYVSAALCPLYYMELGETDGSGAVEVICCFVEQGVGRNEYFENGEMYAYEISEFYEGTDVRKSRTYYNFEYDQFLVYYVDEYDNQGVLSRAIRYSYSYGGVLSGYTITRYENGKQVEEYSYATDETVKNHSHWEYYEDGSSKYTVYSGEGTDKMTYLYLYDADGNTIRSEQYTYKYQSTEVSQYWISEKITGGVQKTYYSSENKTITVTVYDENWNIISETITSVE